MIIPDIKKPGFYVKTSATPTFYDNKGCGGLFIQEITVKWWKSPYLMYDYLKNFRFQFMILKRFPWIMPTWMAFIYLLIVNKDFRGLLFKPMHCGG